MILLLIIPDAAAVAAWLWTLKCLGSEVRRGSWKLPLYFLGAGVLSAGAAIVVEISLEGIFFSPGSPSAVELLLDQVFCTGLVEEGCKFFLFVSFYRRWAPKKNPRDGMVLAAITALGFAGVENLVYGNNYGIGILVVRSIISILSHVGYAGLWGYIYVSLEEDDGRRRKEALASILFFSGTLHGLSNVFVTLSMAGAYLLLKVFSLVLVLSAYRYIGRVMAGKVRAPAHRLGKKSAMMPASRPLSKKERYRMHHRSACICVNKHTYDRALEHIACCRREKKTDLFLLFLEGVCLYALGRRVRGYGAMALALTDMDAPAVDRLRKGLGKLVTEQALRKEVMGVIGEG